MQEAAAVRRAASDATADVVPDALCDTIDDYVANGSFVPGVVTLLSARAAGSEAPEQFAEHAAGVQLIYDGLRLTRELVHSDAWNAPQADRDAADMAILAADVLVSRGFYLLARTEVAEDAVAVVRAFGRDQTDREHADDATASGLDRNLERDVLELALLTGVATGGGRLLDAKRIAADIAPIDAQFDDAEQFLANGRRERLATLPIDSGRALNRND